MINFAGSWCVDSRYKGYNKILSNQYDQTAAIDIKGKIYPTAHL